MESLTVTLPDSLTPYIEAGVAEGGYASVVDYLSELVQADQRRKHQIRLEALIHEGINSGSFVPDPEEYWEAKRRKIIEKYGDVAGRSS